MDPAGHDTCRAHSFCSQETEGGFAIWHPDECEVYYGLWSSLSSDQVKKKKKIMTISYNGKKYERQFKNKKKQK